MDASSTNFDVLIIGSGAAGLSLALRVADSFRADGSSQSQADGSARAANSTRVAILSKGSLTESSTLYAQGGIAAVLDEKDSIEAHVQDTLNAGAGLCDEKIVRFAIERAPQAIQWLIDQQVPFTRNDQQDTNSRYHLTREGGHTHRRVIHAADATGQAIETTLEQMVRKNPNISLFEDHIAIDLITGAKLGLPNQCCLGAYVLDRANDRVKTFRAKTVVLATGGASKVYLYTSNPDTSSGDGIAMAWRAGCRVANMEFNQFHPTCLYHPKAKSYLITEAVRGEGGKLLLPDGSPFMHKFDEREELAPRDIVARAIDHEMKRLGESCVYLDISHKSSEFIKSHFPTVYARCLEFGFDMSREPIPVVPAAHYTCGGVMTDQNACTDIDGLYAVGETAFTGMHGANRMASNSLLECLVFATSGAEHILQALPKIPETPVVPPWDESRVTDSDEEVVVSHNWSELRRFMWDYVGIVRTTKRLQRAKHRVDLLLNEISEYYGNFKVTNDLLELRNLTQVADVIIRSAMARQESRGLHYTLNYPKPNDQHPPINTVLVPENFVGNVSTASRKTAG